MDEEKEFETKNAQSEEADSTVDVDVDQAEADAEQTEKKTADKQDQKKDSKLNLTKKTLLGWGLVIALVVLTVGLVWLLPADEDTADNTQDQQQVEVFSQGAAITYVDGTVEYNSGAGWNEVTQGLSLVEAQQVRTGVDSRAIIALDDGSAIRLNANSEVQLEFMTTEMVVISNLSGEVYSRVTSSDSRQFQILVNEQAYEALGTAFKTVNTENTEGVEVYHSKVEVTDKTEVEEGEAYYTKNKDTEKKDKISKLDLEKLKDDDFLKWNKDQDEKEEEFKDKLGFLKDIDKEEEKEEPEEEPESPSTPSASISASGVKVDKGIKVSWTSTGVDTSGGYKVTFSKSDTTPTYGENSAKYVGADQSSITLDLTDGETWHIRVCSYRGDGVCKFYSNTVSVKAPYVEPEKVVNGSVTATLNESTLSWEFTGTAPYGFKVVWNTSGSPTYPISGDNAGSKLVSGDALNLNDKISEAGTYKVRVCKYTNGTEEDKCVDYSTPDITFVKS